jgi:hypothetical protein
MPQAQRRRSPAPRGWPPAAGILAAVGPDAPVFTRPVFGLARLHDLGVELVHCKGIYYDWVRTLEAALAFQDSHPELSEPPGFWI